MTTDTPLRLWYRDPLSCLYSAFGTVLLNRGLDPLTCLGRNCRFEFIKKDFVREEFYRPAVSADGVLDDIAPALGFISQWCKAESLYELAEAQCTHGTVIVAVDNFHLPFRPAYADVHAAHLIVVNDQRAGAEGREFFVIDAQPPAFSGWLEAEVLEAAMFSSNPLDVQDEFFSSAPIDGRYLTFITAPLIDDAFALTVQAVKANVRVWESAAGGRDHSALCGREGLASYLDLLGADPARLSTLPALYPFGWSLQSEAYLYSENLARVGCDFADLALRDIARAGRDVALAWTPLRLAGAYPPGSVDLDEALHQHGDQLMRAYENVNTASIRWLDGLGEC